MNGYLCSLLMWNGWSFPFPCLNGIRFHDRVVYMLSFSSALCHAHSSVCTAASHLAAAKICRADVSLTSNFALSLSGKFCWFSLSRSYYCSGILVYQKYITSTLAMIVQLKSILNRWVLFYGDYNLCGVREIYIDVCNYSARKFALTKPNQILSYNLASLHLIS